MHWNSCWAAVALSVGVILPVRAQNLITNGSFESGTGTAIDNWTLTPTAAAGTAANYPTATGTSPYGARFLSFNFGVNTAGGSATQDLSGLNGTTTYQLSFAYGALGTTGAQTLQLNINSVGSGSFPAQTYTVATPSLDLSTVWQRATYTFTGMLNLTPTGVTFADLGGTTLVGDSDLVVDDVSLVATVPEPSTYAWIGTGGLALICWRTRRKRAGAA